MKVGDKQKVVKVVANWHTHLSTEKKATTAAEESKATKRIVRLAGKKEIFNTKNEYGL